MFLQSNFGSMLYSLENWVLNSAVLNKIKRFETPKTNEYDPITKLHGNFEINLDTEFQPLMHMNQESRENMVQLHYSLLFQEDMSFCKSHSNLKQLMLY